MTATPRSGPAGGKKAEVPDGGTGQNNEGSQMYAKEKYMARFRRGPRRLPAYQHSPRRTLDERGKMSWFIQFYPFRPPLGNWGLSPRERCGQISLAGAGQFPV